ncbi:MAG TPA: glutathione S-transferase family protein [Stellaceae bacterium]|nr:glutathione S-transferase family protein [Stellaceae bacterium]
MLELYHSVNSVCAQKVRIALAEKGLQYEDHLMTLAGDQFDPAYMRLNPNAVAPTLVHDGYPVIESSVILYYLDEAFSQNPLMPGDLRARAKVRLYNKLIDEYVHNSCTILSFATAFRARFARMTPEACEAELAKSPSKQRSEYKRDVVAHGLDSHFVVDALAHHEKLLSWMVESLKTGPYLVGDMYSLADVAVTPYILRLELVNLAKMWEARPGVAQWWDRVRKRPATETAIFKRMTEADAAPFKNLDPDPWPKVRELLATA